MKIKIHESLKNIFPTLSVGVIVVEGINNTQNSDISFQLLCKRIDNIRKDFVSRNLKYDLNWEDSFKKAGIDSVDFPPSNIALMQRVLTDTKDLNNINNVVNIINSLQLKHMLPIGAHDLDRIEGNISIGKNNNSLPFVSRDNEKEEPISNNEFVYSDEKNVITRQWVWRQSKKTLVDYASKNMIVFVDGINIKDSKLNETMEELCDMFKFFLSPKTISKGILKHELDTNDLKEDNKFAKVDIKGCRTISRDEKIIERILNKATEEILPGKEELKNLLLSGRRLKIYQGFDPTAPTLHIGHTVMARKLEDFRKLGHEVVMLIGDFTARIGDPSDKKATRQQLTSQQVNENLKLYVQQISTILDINNKDNPVKVVFNNDWLGKLTFSDILTLASQFSVQQMLKRDMFQRRIEEDKPIYIHEFMYPLMQGFDSVHLETDIELGGNDQLFNMLAGRDLVKNMLGKEKFVIAGKLLVTNEGTKMGKSEGNMIMLSDSAENIFGKVMAFSDEQIVPGFELLTNLEMSEVEEISEKIKAGANPMELKKILAFEITKDFKGEKDALQAKENFENIFQKKDLSSVSSQINVQAKGGGNIVDIMVSCNICTSKSEARRLVEQGAVQLDGKKVTSWNMQITDVKNKVLKVGKKVVRLI